MERNCSTDDRGYVLIGVLLLVVLGALVAGGMLKMSGSDTRSTAAKEIRITEFNEGEAGIGEVISWLRRYSQQTITAFRRDEFYTHFERSAPSVGDNDDSEYSVPTQIKLAGTDDSMILASDASLATAAAATFRDITTNAMFDFPGQFAAAGFGPIKVRMTLIDAIADDPSKDYGPPPAASPETDFYPVYRIDAMTETDRGAHVYSTIIGDLAHVFDLGIYGQDYLEIRQPCDSYISAAGVYSAASKRANCPAGSNSTAAVHKNEEIYGSLQTNGSIVATAPYGGDTCADFTAGCPNKGETCAGEDCGVPLLEIFQNWDSYCPPGQEQALVNVTGTVGAPQTIAVAGTASPIQYCWTGVTAGANRYFKLTSTSSPYYIEDLSIANNAQMQIEPDTAGKPVELYVRNIAGNTLNGNMAINLTGKPTDFRLYYLGTNNLTLNGTAAMNVALVAPNAQVDVSGNFTYSGALLAKRLLLTGSGAIHYDESLGGSGLVSDMQYRVRSFCSTTDSAAVTRRDG